MTTETTTPPAARSAQVAGALALIAERARLANLERTREIETALLTAAGGEPVPEPEREAAERAAHKIAGSAGTFSLARASQLARELEYFLQARSFADPATLLPAIAALETLQGELSRPAASAPAPAAADAEPAREILVAHADGTLAARIADVAQRRGWAVRWAADDAAAEAALAARWPEVVLVDGELPPSGPAEVLGRVARGTEPTPGIVLYRPGAFLDRVDAARSGATGFVDAAQPPDVLVGAAVDAVGRLRQQRARLLAVDDDPVVLEVLTELFRDSALDLTTLGDPSRFWATLEQAEPDLLLLDVDMPGVTGLELCRLVRADDRWSPLPVLVLTGSVRPEQVVEVFGAGADDYVSKPVVGPELLTRITNRLERVRLLRRMAETDPLTGLANRSTFEAAFTRLVERAARGGQPVSLARLDVDSFRRVNDEHGHALGDAVLQRLAVRLGETFRGEDLVARWGGKEFVVGMSGLRREEGVARVAQVLEGFRDEAFGEGDAGTHVTFSAAVGEVGADADDARALHRALSQTIDAAKRVGGNRVLPVGWRPDGDPRLVDVVLVEDDETLAEVLRHTLLTRGLRGEHIADGLAALDRLTGPDAITARVVLLDVDLPGLNGLDLLARLKAAGVLARTRVIMLTARAGEADVLAALRTGAFDHIAKPFSIPVLMQRIRRAILEGS